METVQNALASIQSDGDDPESIPPLLAPITPATATPATATPSVKEEPSLAGEGHNSKPKSGLYDTDINHIMKPYWQLCWHLLIR